MSLEKFVRRLLVGLALVVAVFFANASANAKSNIFGIHDLPDGMNTIYCEIQNAPISGVLTIKFFLANGVLIDEGRTRPSISAVLDDGRSIGGMLTSKDVGRYTNDSYLEATVSSEFGGSRMVFDFRTFEGVVGGIQTASSYAGSTSHFIKTADLSCSLQ